MRVWCDPYYYTMQKNKIYEIYIVNINYLHVKKLSKIRVLKV